MFTHPLRRARAARSSPATCSPRTARDDCYFRCGAAQEKRRSLVAGEVCASGRCVRLRSAAGPPHPWHEYNWRRSAASVRNWRSRDATPPLSRCVIQRRADAVALRCVFAIFAPTYRSRALSCILHSACKWLMIYPPRFNFLTTHVKKSIFHD